MLTVARWLAGIMAAMLPRRYWPVLDDFVPASSCAFAAGLITLLSGLAIGVAGFVLFATDQVSQNNAALAQSVDPAQITRYMLWAMNGLTLFTFLFLTPQGWAAMYLTSTGVLRTAGPVFDDPHGDFLLTIVDAAVRRAWGGAVRRGEIANRHLLEGPEVSDRVVPGQRLGLPEAELVVVASRIKEGWTPGTVVLSDRGAFRIIDVEDRSIEGRLRRVYSLASHQDLEAFRRTVQYVFPASAKAFTGGAGDQEKPQVP